MTNHFITFAAAVCLGGVSAGEFFRIEKIEDFKNPIGITQENNIFIVRGPARFFSVQKLKLDPSKKYKLSGEFRHQSGPQVQVRLGYAAVDSKNRIISSRYVNPVKDTETEIAASARRGNTVISVKDASKWRTNPAIFHIVFNILDDFSDLPNFSAIPIEKDGIRQRCDVWEVTLKQPLKLNIPEGTKVRQHANGPSYIWNTGVATLQKQWITQSGILSGIAKISTPIRKLWPGTESVRLIIFIFGKKDSVTEIRNVKVEEVE